MADCNRGKPNNGVHWRTDIMGHIRQECGLCFVRMLSLHQRVLQGLGLLPLLPLTLRNVFYDYHNHNVACTLVPYHQKGLPDTKLGSRWVLLPIFHVHFPFPFGKAFL